MSEDELQKITDIIDSCSAVDFSKSYRQKVLSRLRGAIAKATAAAGTVSGMMEIIDLQSRGLDPQAPLNEAETKLHVANSRLADMAVLAVQRLQRISKNLQRENLELSRVRLPELEPRALQLRRVLAVVRDRSDKLVARLSAKAEERPTLEKFAPSFGVSAKELADLRGARAAVLKQLSRAKDELDWYRNWFSGARGWVEEDQSKWKPESAWARCPDSPGAGDDLETGRLTPETPDLDRRTEVGSLEHGPSAPGAWGEGETKDVKQDPTVALVGQIQQAEANCDYLGALSLLDQLQRDDPLNTWVPGKLAELQPKRLRADNHQKLLEQALGEMKKGKNALAVTYLAQAHSTPTPCTRTQAAVAGLYQRAIEATRQDVSRRQTAELEEARRERERDAQLAGVQPERRDPNSWAGSPTGFERFTRRDEPATDQEGKRRRNSRSHLRNAVPDERLLKNNYKRRWADRGYLLDNQPLLDAVHGPQ